ncbi:MAG: hypothetical protein ACTSUE_10915 [Promethearchaeota archaeon]
MAGRTMRSEELNGQTTFNQIRNSVGILVEMMESVMGKEDNSSQKERENQITMKLRAMGERVAVSLLKYWKPEYQALDQMLIKIYKYIFGSRVVVSEPADKMTTLRTYRGKKVFEVIDESCPLCKRPRPTNISGCEVELGCVEGIFKELNRLMPDRNIPLLAAEEVTESKTRGDARCVHRYILDRPETMSYNQL